MTTWALMDAGAMTSASASISAHASANTKGSWTEVIASSTHPAGLLMVTIYGNSAAGDYLVDVGIGAAGSEQAILSNLVFGAIVTNGPTEAIYAFPFTLPPSTRLAARAQATTGGLTHGIRLHLLAQDWHTGTLGKVTTYGANTADSGGTQIDPGASAGVKGAYTEIASSTSLPIRAVGIGLGNQNNSARTLAGLLLDIAVGAAGAEQIVIPDFRFTMSANDDNLIPPTAVIALPRPVAAGTRLAARALCTTNDATDRLFDLVLYAVS